MYAQNLWSLVFLTDFFNYFGPSLIFSLSLTGGIFCLLKFNTTEVFLLNVKISQLKYFVTQLLICGFLIFLIKLIIGCILNQLWIFNLIFFYKFYATQLSMNAINLTTQVSSSLGDALLFLSYFITFVCLWYLGDRGLFSGGFSVFYFLIFICCTALLVNSTNLLVIFLSFELIFMPSLYFVYLLGYAKKVDKTITYLLLWTLLGSFLVLLTIGYLMSRSPVFEFWSLCNIYFSEFESSLLLIFVVIGYGIKIPLFPFYFWLTKVHVEAPAGFSMFLSGFLVKTAFYCLFIIILPLREVAAITIVYTCFLLILFGITEVSLKMWNQVDLKKLIAFATVQEMNLMSFLLFAMNFFKYNSLLSLFFLSHGILSTSMFFLVDQVQKKTQTRNILFLSGSVSLNFLIRGGIWCVLLYFLGFPGTLQFVIEWCMLFTLYKSSGFLGLIAIFIALVGGGLGFAKNWLLIMYGLPYKSLLSNNTYLTLDFFAKDLSTMWFLISFLWSATILLMF